MADIIQKQLLRALKDPNSYTRFMNKGSSNGTVSVKGSIFNKNKSDTDKSLKAIQDLLKAQNANQKVPQVWVKNDFKKEKINHKEIEKRITDSNSLSKELNRIAEDFRATLFNINNMREFDIRLNSLFQTDLSALLDLQRSLVESQMFSDIGGNSVKRISLIQEKMYKVMEKIQHHFIVQQDIKHKKKDQTVVINVNEGGSEGSSPIFLPNDNDNGESFFGPLFQYLGIRNIAKGMATVATARATGKALSSEVRSSKAVVAKNADKMKAFLAKHKVLGFLAKHKLGAVIIAALTYGALTLDSSEFGKLLKSTGGLISSTLQPLAQTLKDSFMGGNDLSMRGMASQSVSSYINGNGYFNTLGQIASHSTQSYLFGKGIEKSTVLAKTIGQAGKNAIYNARLSVNAKLSDIISKQVKKLESASSKGIKGWVKGTARDLFDMADDKLVKRYLNTSELQKTVNYKGFSNQLRKNRLLQKMVKKVPVIGVGAGCLFSVPDIINFFSVDMDKQINHALEILKRDESRFKDKARYQEICKKIISNMESSRKWWLATIMESITLSAINIGVGAGTGGIGLVVSVLVTSVLDALFDWVRDVWLGFDFDLIDFDNPYTFISQEDLVKATTVSFLLNGSNIRIEDIKEEFRRSGDARAVATQSGVNAIIRRINGQRVVKYDFSNTFVKKPGWSGSVTTARVNWGLTVLCLNAFRSGLHYKDNTIKNNALEPHSFILGGDETIEKYGDDVISVSGGQSAIYYPKMEGGEGLYQPITNGNLTASKILTGDEASSVLLIKNIIYSLLFLYTISMLFRNNINIKLRDEIKNFINGKNTYIGFRKEWVLAVEFLRFNYAGYPGDKWKGVSNEIEFLRKNIAPNVVNSLNDVNSWCQNNEGLTQVIKSYSLIYLLYRFKYRNSNNTNIREALNKIDVETVRTMVEILRSPEDWDKIYDYYDKNKENITEITKGESLYIGSDLKLNNTSSFKNEVIKGVDITNPGSGYESLKFGNIGIDYDLGEYIELDSSLKDDGNYINKVKLAGAITQEALKTNNNASLAIAEVCLAYADAYNKNMPDNRKIKLDNLDDIVKNYHKALMQMLQDNKGENKKYINELSTMDDKSISKEDIIKVVNKLVVTQPNNNIAMARVDNINGNVMDSEYRGKLSEGVLKSSGINYISDKNYFGNTNPTIGKVDNNYGNGNVSGEFDLNSVMNSNIYDKGNGIYYSDDPFVQYVLNKESGGRANAKSPLSSATGLFQFTEATWADITKGKDFSLATDPYENFKAFKLLVKRNASILKNTGTPLTRYTMYMAHQQGAGGIANISKIASGKLKKGDKDYDKTMTNINKNVPPNLRRSGIWDTLSDQDKASNFLSAWEADANGTQVNVIRSGNTEADMQEDAVKNDDGVSDALFITDIMNDMLFGTQLCM